MTTAPTKTVVIRADGSTQLGHGHIFRTLTLAAELSRRSWKITYICRDLEGSPLNRIRAANHEVRILPAEITEKEDIEQTTAIALEADAQWLVVDRYASPEQAYLSWQKENFKTLAIDDICEHRFPVDILLNQNLNAADLPYETRENTVRLFGPNYALVRETYRKARPLKPKNITEVKRVMVFMGGTDPLDATSKILTAINEIKKSLKIEVIVGSGYRYFDNLQKIADESSHVIEVYRDLPDLVEPMTRADVAIAAGGSVTWELCCMGVPMILFPTARNQEAVAQSLTEITAAFSAVPLDKVAPSQVAHSVSSSLKNISAINLMAEVNWKLVDGLGGKRIADAIAQNTLTLRDAKREDIDILYEWVNDPAVRSSSVQNKPISWAEHVKWFSEKLASKKTRILIAYWANKIPIGQIRFDDIGPYESEIDVSLSSPARGQHLASLLISSGSRMVLSNKKVLHAYVKPLNIPSVRAFLCAGYKDNGLIEKNRENLVHFSLTIDRHTSLVTDDKIMLLESRNSE